MTNKQFIDRFVHNGFQDDHKQSPTGALWHNNGILYSYGYHYPLMFKVRGLVFRNIESYSNTTGKHIGLCGAHSDHDVKLYFEDAVYRRMEPMLIVDALVTESIAIDKTISKIKRKDTIKEQNLRNRLAQIDNAINALAGNNLIKLTR